jgi:transposase-like protein
MKKVQPSERISKEIYELLENGCEERGDLLSILVKQSTLKLIQEVLEQEIKDYLGRGYYERNASSVKGYRNGYEPKRLKTAEGELEVAAPQLRDTEGTYRSEFLRNVGPLSSNLERLVIESYVRGLSTRDVEEMFRTLDGKRLISKDGVSEITEELSKEYERFCNRDLSGYDVVYLFVDGVCESLRLEAGFKEALLCAWGILSNGRKVLLHIALGNKESYESWEQFFRDMSARGLRMPLLVISDGAPGLLKGIEDCFSGSKRQRCIAHKLRNISNKLPHYAHDEVMPKIRNVFYQTNKDVALLCVTKLIEEYAQKYPSAMKCLQDDLDNCLNFMLFPAGHHKHIRTTNLLERVFVEQKRRTKIIPRFLDEKSCLKLVYATLIRVSEKWRKVKMSEYDLTLLRNIRHLYGWKKSDDGFISKQRAA